MTHGASAGQDRVGGRFKIDGMRLRGVVSAVPRRIVVNAQFEADLSPEAIAETTRMIGVKERRWAAPGQTTGDLCHDAARVLLERLSWAPTTIDALIFVSQTPDHPLPATACILQHRLGLSTGAAAFDVGLGCSGYVYGLWLAGALLKAGCRRVLLLAGDTSSRLTDPRDRGTAMLFGDAGTASAVERDSAAGPTTFRLGSDGAGACNLMIPKGARSRANDDGAACARLAMDGSQVFSFTLQAVPLLVRDTLAEAALTADAVDLYLMHQSNGLMLKRIGEQLNVPSGRLPINIDRFGNTSSASIPLLIATDVAHAVTSRETRLLLAGFGVGYSWGACTWMAPPLDCAEVITT